MKKSWMLIAVVALLSSCTMTMPVSSSGPVTGPKSGTASANVILGLHFNGDYSIEKAAANGGITNVATVKTKYTNILMVYQNYKTTVTGE